MEEWVEYCERVDHGELRSGLQNLQVRVDPLEGVIQLTA